MFVRDQVTWLIYLMLAYFAYVPAAFGPLMPFLRADLSLSYAQGGLHLTALSFGMVLVGVSGSAIAHRWGRRHMLWAGAIGVALGAVLLVMGQHLAMTLASAFVMGVCGSLVVLNVQAILSDHHGSRRAIALTEANIGASLSAALAPMFISGFQRMGFDWRFAMLPCFVLLAVLLAFFFRTPIANADRLVNSRPQNATPARLSWIYKAYWVCILLFVALEWSIGVWGADFMVGVNGLSKVDAATVMGLYLGTAILARIAISRLTRHWEAGSLLILALGLVALGFPFFWLSRSVPLAVAGMLLAGLGVTNLYPLTMTLAMSAASDQTDLASSRISLAVGLAGGSAPYLLGWIADQVGLWRAFSIVPVFLVAGFAGALLINRVTGRQRSPTPA